VIVGDVLWREALRLRLGRETNAERRARDADLRPALAAYGRGAGGRLQVLVGKTSGAADPLRPARRRLPGVNGQRLGRVRWLWREVAAGRPTRPWARAWRLRPRDVPAPANVSVTVLRDWLAGPFRLWLRHALRRERVDPAKDERGGRGACRAAGT
jgi:hypothetical protein